LIGRHHTGNITSGQFQQIVRHSCLWRKKIKTTPPYKIKSNFYDKRTSGRFAVAATLHTLTRATQKELLLTTLDQLSGNKRALFSHFYEYI
jgi:hypothetical protein